MRARLLAVIAALLLPAPAPAETTQIGERTQETIPVGDSRFLIFVGAPDGRQVGYTVDMIKIEEGIPFYVPLFMEEFDTETKTARLSYGVAFYAVSYHYDRAANLLNLKTVDDSTHTRYDYRYRLDNDIFHLQQVTRQDSTCEKNCKAKTVFKAGETPKA